MPTGKKNVDPQVTDDTVRAFTEAIRVNTMQTVKLRAEIKRQREVEEKNIAFLQELVKKLVVQKMEQDTVEEKGRWEVVHLVVNYGLKVGGVVLLAYVALKLGLPLV